MVTFPQTGGCLCGDLRYVLREDPVSVYACHCTDCQTETGSGFYHAVIVRLETFELTKGAPDTWQVELRDGRVKGSYFCPRCKTKTGGPSVIRNLAAVDGGTLDDSSWAIPAGHIWTRSAQPWIRLPEGSLQFPMAPGDEGTLDIVRAWKGRAGAS